MIFFENSCCAVDGGGVDGGGVGRSCARDGRCGADGAGGGGEVVNEARALESGADMKTEKRRLTVVEKRAKMACEQIASNGGGSFGVEWKKSKMWGYCPSIDYMGKAAHAGGCGYDKLSVCVAQFLQFLGLERRGGHGINAVIEAAKNAGWELKHVASGNTFDGFEIKKIEAAAEAGEG